MGGRSALRRNGFLSAITSVALLCGGLVSAVSPPATADDTCSAPKPAPLRFEKPVYIDEHRSGGEPVSVVAKDGSIVVGAHLGTTLAYLRTVPSSDWLTQYRNQTFVWRSTDDGKTWSRSESILPGAHTLTSTGLSDPDFARDAAGNLYGTEIDLANVSVFSSHDNGKTWPDANPISDSGDRPWLAARGPNEVYLRITGNLQKSTDGGQTWTQLTDPPAYGKIFVDPSDPKGLYAGLGEGVGVAVSRDDGETWDSYSIPGASNNSVMDSIGVDEQGWVYYGYAEKNEIKFASFNPDTKKWSKPVTVTKSSEPMWAWTVAGDAGRAAVAWYERVPVKDEDGTYDLHVKVAVTTNGRGSIFRCADGSTVKVAPQFSVADAVGRQIYRGPTPCNGTGCNVSGDRRLGDFFTVNFNKEGRVFVTTGDTMLSGVQGEPDTVSHPLFSIAKSSSPKLVK